MSIWDGIVVLILAFAIFQGYRRGFLLRMTGWVGGVCAILLARPIAYEIDDPVSRYIDGQKILSEWIKSKILGQYTADQFLTGSGIYKWIENVEGIRDYRDILQKQLESTGNEVFSEMSDAVANTIATPLWHVILTFVAWLGVMFTFVVLGRLASKLLDKVPFLSVADGFLGAIISVIVVFIVLIVINTIGLYFLDEKTYLGMMFHKSFFASFFRNIFDLFIK